MPLRAAFQLIGMQAQSAGILTFSKGHAGGADPCGTRNLFQKPMRLLNVETLF
jgi:hypothetical protein